MFNLDIIKLIAILTIFVSFIFIFFLVTVKTKNKLPNIILAGLILFCSIDISGLFMTNNFHLLQFSKAFTFLIFPAYYFYVRLICDINFKLELKNLIHLILFFVYIVIFLFNFLLNNFNFDSMMFTKTLQTWLFIFSSLILKLQATYYLFLTFFILKRHKIVYFENYSEGNIAAYEWLFKVNIIFLLTLPLTFLKEYLYFTNYHGILKLVNLSLMTIALLLFCWFIFKALLDPKFFRAIDLKINTKDKLFQTKKNFQDENERHTRLIKKLILFMNEHEPYLNPSLTLQELSDNLSISTRELSFVINSKIGKHFFDFVNEYRIKKAKEFLKDFKNNKFTIQEIFYKSGFNSKSSFNTAFKKHTSTTPSEFKKKFI